MLLLFGSPSLSCPHPPKLLTARKKGGKPVNTKPTGMLPVCPSEEQWVHVQESKTVSGVQAWSWAVL